MEGFALPPGPKGQKALCFDKNRFAESDFSVDAFLHDHRNAGAPETLRDDLGAYLKVLRSAMIELIDEDYAHFVDLSSGLTGLDAEIANVRRPLEELKERVTRVEECLSEATKELSGRLERRRALRERKRSLQHLAQARTSLKKLSEILFSDESEDHAISEELLERASSEFVRLRFAFSKCDRLVSEEQRSTYEKISDVILSACERAFLEGLRSDDEDQIRRCLRTYSTLDRIAELETIVREKVVGAGVRDLIGESALQKSPSGLKGIFDGVMTFFDRNLKSLVRIARSTKFNFVLNSFWPEVEYRFELQMASMFAPGNPELFYSRYMESLEFLKKIIDNLEGEKAQESFYEHASYKNFQQKWNLPIYFQIRFQEIAGSLEAVLSEPASPLSFNPATSPENFILKASDACWTSLTSCWAQGIFISALTHRFWKLTLQIISRYCTWVNVVIKQGWPNSGSSDSANKQKIPSEKLKFSVSLHYDVRKLIISLPTLLEVVKTRLDSLKHVEIFEKCLSDSRGLLESKLPQIQKVAIVQISSDSVVHLKEINDIPRLFRKTNRDIPTKPCPYVSMLTKASFDFHSSYVNMIGEIATVDWLESIFSIVTAQYYGAVDNVLTSIQKTEDSLRRLKQIRDRPAQQQPSMDKAGVSDDDKIRIQLKVDVDFYSKSLSNVKVNVDKVERLKDLMNLIDRATATRANSTVQ